jgi:dTDP-4-amino-4,6-dideoxygalactose transaminase
MIPLVDLKAQYAAIQAEVNRAIQRVLDNTSFILGEEVSVFEEAFASYCETKYAIGTSSGTSALHLALLACGVGPGDEVITTPHTFMATAESIIHTGAKPVFVDIDLDTYNLDPSQIQAVINEKTKAIVPVHLYGTPADMDPILEIASKHGLKVVEDAAQAHGAEYNGRRTGSVGDVACFSFYPGKNLGAFGDGGCVVTSDKQIADRVRMLRNHGRTDKYRHEMVGYGYRLDALQAAILGVKLLHLEEWTKCRRENAKRYHHFLNGFGPVLPTEPNYARSVYHLYVIRVPERDQLLQYLRSKGISAGIHYPIPLHLQPAFAGLGYKPGAFPSTEKAASEVISLPMYPELRQDQIEEVAQAVQDFYGRG